MHRYVAITPARDEERFLPLLIESVAAQTLRPERWTILDDGSLDATPDIIEAAAQQYQWVTSVHLPPGRRRLPGGESALMHFMQPEHFQDTEYIFRLDADVSFGPRFAESVLGEFANNPMLGIASGVLYEPAAGTWRRVASPLFHTHGAAKIYSVECFKAIGGLEGGMGWDTIDEVRAIMLGFETRAFEHLRIEHHRRRATAQGVWRGYWAQGYGAYYIGYAPEFFLARAAKVAAIDGLLASMAMIAGFIDSYLWSLPRVDDPQLIRFVRRQQRRRLLMRSTIWR